jgi:hypothetical protein
VRMHGVEHFKMLFDYVPHRTGPGVCQVAAWIRLHFPPVVTKEVFVIVCNPVVLKP